MQHGSADLGDRGGHAERGALGGSTAASELGNPTDAAKRLSLAAHVVLADVSWRARSANPFSAASHHLRGCVCDSCAGCDAVAIALGRGGDRNRRTAVVEKPLGSDSLLRSVCAALEGRS